MTDPAIARTEGRRPAGYGNRPASRTEPANLADILERVLDKGIVIAGDIRVNLLDIELLTIKLRLVVASVDKAREMGIDWWEHDPTLSAGERDLVEENRRLRQRLGDLQAGREDGGHPDGVEAGAREGSVTGGRGTGSAAAEPAREDRDDG